MSAENAKRFFESLGKDPALVRQLCQGANALEDFLQRAVAEANQRGYEFSPEEARGLLLERTRAAGAHDELSEGQLEKVAGGHCSALEYDMIAALLAVPAVEVMTMVGKTLGQMLGSQNQQGSTGTNSNTNHTTPGVGPS
jgi:predicted ribosomally synthesized peptide with nif11-like leader